MLGAEETASAARGSPRVDVLRRRPPFAVLEDLVEVCMVSDCESVFDWIEGHAEELGHPDMLARGKLIAVRTCNQLLRRLSKADGTRLW